MGLIRREKVELVKISEEDLGNLDDEKNLAVDYVKTEEKLYRLKNVSLQIERHKENLACIALAEVVDKVKI